MSDNIKPEAHRLVDNLAEDSTWDDLMEEIYVRQSIESGLRDRQLGNVKTVAETRAKYGLEWCERLAIVPA